MEFRNVAALSTVSRTLTNQLLHISANSRPMIRSMQGSLWPGFGARSGSRSEQEAPAVCLPWYDHVHRSTCESSHAPSHGELDIQSTLWPSKHWKRNVVLLNVSCGERVPTTFGTDEGPINVSAQDSLKRHTHVCHVLLHFVSACDKNTLPNIFAEIDHEPCRAKQNQETSGLEKMR